MLKVIIKKEFRQFFRNAFLPKLCLMFPFMVMLLMPLVANMEVRHVSVAVVDKAHTPLSRLMAERISASEHLSLEAEVSSYAQAMELIDKGTVDVIVEIGNGAGREGAAPLRINITSNAVNATKGSLGMQYVNQVIAQTLAAQGNGAAPSRPAVASGSTLYVFNPTLNYRYFMIPALMIMLLVMICGFLPALNVVGEKEVGTIEQINVSPVDQMTFTLGKVIPYWIIGFIVLSIAMTVGWLVYGLSPAGNLLTIFAGALLFVVFMSAMGMIIANSSSTMQQAMFIMFFFVVVFILMSGLMTPISSMPDWARRLTYAIPPRYFIEIMRATYLRGATISEQWQSFACLGAFATAAVLAAVLTYRKQS